MTTKDRVAALPGHILFLVFIGAAALAFSVAVAWWYVAQHMAWWTFALASVGGTFGVEFVKALFGVRK